MRFACGYLGIVLSWNFSVMAKEHEPVEYYQIYAYQETSAAPQSRLWRKVIYLYIYVQSEIGSTVKSLRVP